MKYLIVMTLAAIALAPSAFAQTIQQNEARNQAMFFYAQAGLTAEQASTQSGEALAFRGNCFDPLMLLEGDAEMLDGDADYGVGDDEYDTASINMEEALDLWDNQGEYEEAAVAFGYVSSESRAATAAYNRAYAHYLGAQGWFMLGAIPWP